MGVIIIHAAEENIRSACSILLKQSTGHWHKDIHTDTNAHRFIDWAALLPRGCLIC